MKEQLAADLSEGQVAEFVENDEVHAGEIFGEPPLPAGAGFEWVVDGPHIMLIIPNLAQLEGLPTDPKGKSPSCGKERPMLTSWCRWRSRCHPNNEQRTFQAVSHGTVNEPSQNTRSLSAVAVASANSSMVLRRAPSTSSASVNPRASTAQQDAMAS